MNENEIAWQFPLTPDVPLDDPASMGDAVAVIRPGQLVQLTITGYAQPVPHSDGSLSGALQLRTRSGGPDSGRRIDAIHPDVMDAGITARPVTPPGYPPEPGDVWRNSHGNGRSYFASQQYNPRSIVLVADDGALTVPAQAAQAMELVYRKDSKPV
jgi:hypothetical protein